MAGVKTGCNFAYMDNLKLFYGRSRLSRSRQYSRFTVVKREYCYMFWIFFPPLGLICSRRHLSPAGSQCDIWRSDVAASAEEAYDYAQLI